MDVVKMFVEVDSFGRMSGGVLSVLAASDPLLDFR